MKNLSIFTIATLLMLSFSSCTKEYYQVLTAKSDALSIQSDNMVYEDENCRITYNLWAPGGNAGFEFHNKTDKNIVVDMKETFFIFNDHAFDYYLDRTFTVGKAARLSAGQSDARFGSVSATLYGTWYGYDASANALTGVNQTKSQTGEIEANSSVEAKEKPLVCIPAHSAKFFYEYQIMANIYRECGFLRAPRKPDEKSLQYTASTSPVKFGNIISYTVEGNSEPIVVNNRFYIAYITNMNASGFAKEIQIEKDCMGKRYGANRYKTIFTEQAPNKFYLQYYYNAKDTDKY